MAATWPLPTNHQPGDPGFTQGMNQLSENLNAMHEDADGAANTAVAAAATATAAAQQAHDISNIEVPDDTVKALFDDADSESRAAAAQAMSDEINTAGSVLATTLNGAIGSTAAAILVAPAHGDDAHDGLAWGSAKATITAALAALPSEGGRILVAAGTITEDSINLDRDNVTIEGIGHNRAVIDGSGTEMANVITAIGLDNIHVRGLRVLGSGQGSQPPNVTTRVPNIADLANAGSGIILAGCSNSTVTNCELDSHGGTTGVGNYDGVAAVWLTYGCTGCTVENNTVTNSRNGINEDNFFAANPHGNKILNNRVDSCRFGIACDSESASTGSLVTYSTAYPVAYDTLIQGNTITNCLQSGIDLNKGRRVRVAFNYVEHCGTENGNAGIAAYGSASNYAIGLTVVGNEIYRCGLAGSGGHGIRFATFAYSSVVIGNVIAGNVGDGINATGASRYLRIEDNECSENSGSGIVLDATGGGNVATNIIKGNIVRSNGAHGIRGVGMVSGIITGNQVRNNSATTTNTCDGISLTGGSQHNAVTGNNVGGATQRFSIAFSDATSYHNSVTGNDFGDPTSAGVGTDYGTARIGIASGAENQHWGENRDRIWTTSGAPSGNWPNGATVHNTGDQITYIKHPAGWRMLETLNAFDLTGTSAPSSTPDRVGQQFVDMTDRKVYIAVGTSSSADWVSMN